MHVGAREKNRTVLEEALHDRRVLPRDRVAQCRGAGSIGCARHRDVVFDDDGQPRQCAERTLCTLLIDLTRIVQHALLIDPGDRVER